MPRARSREIAIHIRAIFGRSTRDIRTFKRELMGLRGLSRGLTGGLLGMNSALMGQGAAIAGLVMGIRASVLSYERYSAAQARLRGILASTNADIRAQRGLMESADVAARQYGFGISESAEAMGTLLETGVGAHGAGRYFQIASEFARAANTDVSDAATVLVDSMRQFNMESEEGASILAGSFTLAARMSSTSIADLQHAFRYASTEFSALGYEAQETVSALAGMSAIGIRASSAGTRLRRMIVNLHRVTPIARREIRRLGVDTDQLDRVLYDSQGRLRPFTEAVGRMAAFFEELPSQAAKNAVAFRIFGVRAASAGMLFSRLHQQGDRWLRVYRELNDVEQVQANLAEAAAQNMRGFAAQMRLARTAAEELGIVFMETLFGATDQASEGFGTYLRNLMLAVRFQDDSVEHTAIMIERYSELNQETREQARELRQVIVGLTDFLKVLWDGIKAVAKFVAEWPRLSAAIAGLVLVIGPVYHLLASIGMIGAGLVKVFGALNAAWAFAGAKLAALSTTLASVLGAFGMAAAVFGGLAIGEAISGWTSELLGFGEEWEAQNRRFEDAHIGQTLAAQIPVLRQIVRFFYRIYEVTRQIATNIRQAFGRFWRRETFTATGAVRGRMEGITAEAGTEEYTRARTRAASIELTQTMMEIAGQFRTAGMSASEANMRFMNMIDENVNINEQERRRLRDQFERLFSSRTMSEYNRRTSRFGGSVSRAGTALNEFINILHSGRMNGTPAGTPGVAPTALRTPDLGPLAAAGYVNRDVLASAAAVTGGRMVAGPEGNQQVGATPQSQQPINNTTVAEMNLNIPVEIDGREVAIAAGRYNLQVDQRRGVTIAPGSRRRVLENGAV